MHISTIIIIFCKKIKSTTKQKHSYFISNIKSCIQKNNPHKFKNFITLNFIMYCIWISELFTNNSIIPMKFIIDV
jgi:hypothetical protein